MSRDAAIRFLADRLAVEPSLVEAAARQAEAGAYRVIRVPRGDGRVRELAEPDAELKAVQAAVLHRLLDHAPVSPFAHGFVRGRSIVTNARVHLTDSRVSGDVNVVQRGWRDKFETLSDALLSADLRGMVNADIRDAFPSVSRGRVRETVEWRLGPLLKHATPTPTRDLLLATYDLLADLCTFRDCLPQGAPTSGSLLNLACARLDRLVARRLLRGFAREHGLHDVRYSRYADDLTFTAAGEFPPEFVDALGRVVLESGFELNRRKTERTSTRAGDLVICGIRLTADGQLGLPRRTLRRYRALFDHALAFEPTAIPDDVRHRLTGTLGFLRMVYATPPPILEVPLQRLLAAHGDWLPGGRLPEPEWWQLPYGLPSAPGDGPTGPGPRSSAGSSGGKRSSGTTAWSTPDAWPEPPGPPQPPSRPAPGRPYRAAKPKKAEQEKKKKDELSGCIFWIVIGVIFLINVMGGC